MIRPVNFYEGIAAYRLRRGREWLTAAEGEVLAALLDRYRAADLPPRVGRALWRVDHAVWQRWADVALPELVSGLEALGKIGYGQLTAQFKRRITALAADVEVDGVDEALCGRMYAGRSDWVHGSHVALFGREGESDQSDKESERVIAEIAKMQEVLRAAIRKAIEDPDLGAVFTDNAAIAARWPA